MSTELGTQGSSTAQPGVLGHPINAAPQSLADLLHNATKIVTIANSVRQYGAARTAADLTVAEWQCAVKVLADLAKRIENLERVHGVV